MRHRAQILDRHGAREIASRVKATLGRAIEHCRRGSRQGAIGRRKARQRPRLPRDRALPPESGCQPDRGRG